MRVWPRVMLCWLKARKDLSNIELGRRLGISTNAARRVQHKLMQATIERDRRYKLGAAGPESRSTTPISAANALAKARGGAGAAIRLLSLQWVPPRMAGRNTPAFKSCAASRLAKPNGYAPASRLERRSSATAANGSAALPSSRVARLGPVTGRK